MTADTKTMTVCHVVGDLADQGGTWSCVRAVAAAGAREGVSHVVWMHRDYQPKDVALKFVCAGRLTQVNLSLTRDLACGMLDTVPLFRWVRKQQNVVLHAHTRPGILAAALVCCLAGRPLVIHIHGMPRWRWVYRALRRVGGGTFVFNSHNTCRHFGDLPEQSHIVMPPIAWPTHPPVPSGEPARFVAAAAFYSWKNLHLIIDAFDQLRPRHPTAQLDIYGDTGVEPASPYARFLKERARRSSGVRLLKYDPAWLDQWRPSDVFVHAAENEPFGIVMLEALAQGCRMAVPPGTFLDELAPPPRMEGLYRAKGLNPSALAEAMEAALMCPTTSQQLWHRRLGLRHQFSAEHAVAQLDAIYRALGQR